MIHCGYIGIVEKKMETTIMSYIGLIGARRGLQSKGFGLGFKV